MVNWIIQTLFEKLFLHQSIESLQFLKSPESFEVVMFFILLVRFNESCETLSKEKFSW